MSCDELAIEVNDVSKVFELYEAPRDQLKQFIYPRLQRLIGRRTRNYYKEFWALRNISFEIKKGDSVGIVGRNGSGKSTLLQIITGTLNPTFGTVKTTGRVAALLELGSGFNPEFSGRDNVYLNGMLLGLARHEIDARFDDIAAFADIGIHLEQPVKTYSSGMIVRLAFAVHTVLNPDILIVDEALAVGDALFQKRCFRQIDKLVNNGCTLLFVSHDQEVIRSLTNKAIFLNGGIVKSSGQSTDVLFQYRELLQQEDERAYQSSLDRSAPDMIGNLSQRSYGNLDVQILSAQVLNAENEVQSSFYVGDIIKLEIECECNVDTENLNVAFRIINKEGVKVTTWGTLNEDMEKFDADISSSFWIKKFRKGEKFKILFEGVVSLGENLYELQVVVAREYDKFYNDQRILHWVDEACHFKVLLKHKKYVFDGVCDMRLRSVQDK